MDWMFMPLPAPHHRNSYVEILMPHVMVLRDGDPGALISSWGWNSPWMGFVPRYKIPETALVLWLCEDKEVATYEPGSESSPVTESAGALLLFIT